MGVTNGAVDDSLMSNRLLLLEGELGGRDENAKGNTPERMLSIIGIGHFIPFLPTSTSTLSLACCN